MSDTPHTETPPPQSELSQPLTKNWGEEPNSDERTWALIAHLSNLFAPAIGPFVVWLIKKDESRFVAYHAIQATIFHALMQWVIAGLVVGLTCGLGFPILFVSPIFAVVWGLKANEGLWKGYPVMDSVGK